MILEISERDLKMLIDLLRNRLNDARKSKKSWERDVLSTLIGEMTANAPMVNGVKVIDDKFVLDHFAKHRKKLRDALDMNPSIEMMLNYNHEIALVNEYLPEMLGKDVLEKIIKDNEFKNIGKFMAHLKDNFPNRYDGKLASDVWKAVDLS